MQAIPDNVVEAAPAQAPGPVARFDSLRDGAALLALFLLSLWFIAVSWRKWPDPLVDFGRELYTPWRLAEGAVLYRDVDAYYGPLSQHLNALLFSLFGPGLMVLVTANLVVFAAIVALVFWLCRRAWGRGAAFVAAALFVAICGFSQLVEVGNYNFATPYAHEAVHGLLVCLALVAALNRWTRGPTLATSFAIGGLFGLTAVLKPEFMVAGGIVTAAAVAWRWRRVGRSDAALLAAWVAGAVAPSALFALLFARHVPWVDALGFAGRAWLNVVGTDAARFVGESIQLGFLGLDRPLENLLRELRATALALIAVAIASALAWAVNRIRAPRPRDAAAVIAAGATLVAGLRWIDWLEFGLALPGMVALAVVATSVRAWRHDDGSGRGALPLLLALLAAALLARMALYGRIYHYGFYQAALGVVVVAAMLLGDLPARISSEARTRRTVFLAVALLAGTGAFTVAAESARLLALKVEPIGDGRDRFLSFPPDVQPSGALVRMLTDALRKAPPEDTLLVLPEGAMINYLSRRPSPVAPLMFFSSTTYGEGEARVVRDLAARPPDRVAILSRDLREYGIRRYGEAAGRGRLILAWVDANYRVVARAGGDPLDPAGYGALLFERRR